jgi:hypothetical protein
VGAARSTARALFMQHESEPAAQRALTGVRRTDTTSSNVASDSCNYCMLIFTDTILLCLLLNKPHLFSLTQLRLILTQLLTVTCMLYVSACTVYLTKASFVIFY